MDIHSACKVFIDSFAVYTHKKSLPVTQICDLQCWGKLCRPLNEDRLGAFAFLTSHE